MAAHSKYDPEFVKQVQKLCELGATERDIADFFEVIPKTIWQWKQEHPEFAAALKVGKEHADERVVQSLYRRATGYSYDAEEVFCQQGEVTRVQVVKHIPPDTTACIFWTKNRIPEDWRDVKAVEHSGAIKHSHVEELSDAELERIARSGGNGIAKKKGGKKDASELH